MVDDLATQSAAGIDETPLSGQQAVTAAGVSGSLGLDERSSRVRFLLAVVVGCALVIVGRLVYIQVLQHAHYAEAARAEHWQKQTVRPQRGSIVDSSGSPLAVSVPYEDVFADVAQIADDVQSYASQLAPILGGDPADLELRLRADVDAPVLLAGRVPAARASSVRRLELDGIFLRSGHERVHPQGNLAAQLLGIVGADEKGLSGLEALLDEPLGGQPGWVYAERDTGGEEIALGTRDAEPPIDGATIRLTLDSYAQQVAERELASGIAAQHAKSGSVVVLDPRTGAILALAGYPTIAYDDPGLFDSPAELFRVGAVADMYEPGSVFKIFTMAAALDGGAVRPDTTIVDSGRLSYAGGMIHNAREFPAHPSTMTLALQRSSNVGATYAATRLGAAAFYDYVTAFGFGSVSGSQLPGEVAGLVRRPGDPSWIEFDLATNAFGQGIATTPVQLAAGAAAIANGGTLYRPYLVASVEGPLTRRAYHPTLVRQVISPRTARELTEMMVATVDYVEAGRHRLSYLPEFRLAGKTGTAEIASEHGYDPNRTIASFVGFGPAESPRFVIVVRIDEPKDNQWGESVAAPVFKSIAAQLLAYYRVAPDEARLASGRRS